MRRFIVLGLVLGVGVALGVLVSVSPIPWTQPARYHEGRQGVKAFPVLYLLSNERVLSCQRETS